MRYITIPPELKLQNLITREPTGQAYPFFTWLQDIVLMDQRFAVSWKTSRAAAKIADAFFGQPEGTTVAIEDADYDILKEAAEEPQRLVRASGQVLRGYEQPALFQQVGAYIEAIVNATTKASLKEVPAHG